MGRPVAVDLADIIAAGYLQREGKRGAAAGRLTAVTLSAVGGPRVARASGVALITGVRWATDGWPCQLVDPPSHARSGTR